MDAEALRAQIIASTREYYNLMYSSREFVPGKTLVPCSGRVFDDEELTNLIDASLEFWLTSGRFSEQFESALSKFFGSGHAILCNSGSSANLLALSALTSPKLGDKRLQAGDEVITVATGFPTTITPILQNNLLPVFLDVSLGDYNVAVDQLEAAYSPKSKAIMLAHTLGNPFNLDAVTAFANKHDLWLIEDNCDALGSTYNGKLTGTFGQLSTLSFYPAHHITTGEGGCVLAQGGILKTIVESFRDWGRDCWCNPGLDNTCGKRFKWQLGNLPFGYDHKYIYSHLGYNLKMTDLQASVGLAQIKKLPVFINARKQNWKLLSEGLKQYENDLILPHCLPLSDPSWFGFAITVRPEASFNCVDLVQHLENNNVATRRLFGGNIIRQPAFADREFRVIGELKNSDLIMTNTFWIGVYPGLTASHIEYVLSVFKSFFSGSRASK